MKERTPKSPANPDRPRAYLNFVLFDEDFNLVDGSSGVKQVAAQPDELQTLAQDNVIMEKSGFLYVYTSNDQAQINTLKERLSGFITKKGQILVHIFIRVDGRAEVLEGSKPTVLLMQILSLPGLVVELELTMLLALISKLGMERLQQHNM